VVLDRRGGLLAEIGPEARSWVRLVDLPRFVGQAFVAIEDRRFYQHDGVDVIGVVGAIRDNLLRGFGSRGASTITQQLVGAMGLVDRSDISLGRKLREAELARALERRHTKSEILEAYLNYINFGHGWYGVESAARHYFATPAQELTLEEAALLAALPKSPAGYDPRAHPGTALRRRNLVLRRMQEQRFISPQEARAAMAVPLRLAPDDGYSVRAPYAVEWVRQWLVERYGLTAVNTGGMRVTTTIDPELQDAANRSLASGLARVESLPGYRWPRYSARPRGAAGQAPARGSYLQGALVALDPWTGDVTALVGGRDFRDSEFNRAVQSVRQAGSAFKPFVYAAALSQGVLPTAILSDEPLSMPASGGSTWSPENADGVFRGPVTARTALVHSINVPVIRLALAVGLDSVVAAARRMGLSTPIPSLPPVAIGAAEVRPIEMAAAFAVLATLGTYRSPRVVALVQDDAGVPIYEAPAPESVPSLDPRIAFQITSILQDAVERGTGAAARRAGLPAGLPVAGKTGTTNDNADVWFVGYTPDLVASVWLGFDRPQSIARGAFGGTLAAPIWGSFVRGAYRDRALPEEWEPPAGLVALRVSRQDGRPAPGDTTETSVTEYFLEGTEPTPQGIVQRLLRRLRIW
jgi:penicillin-binding protein 1A